MVYAIIEDGGKQYKVEPGMVVTIELRDLEEGQTEVAFDRVLYYKEGDIALIGQPFLQGAKVVGKVQEQTAGPKVYPTHFRRRKDSMSRIGHRQKYLAVEITDIQKPD